MNQFTLRTPLNAVAVRVSQPLSRGRRIGSYLASPLLLVAGDFRAHFETSAAEANFFKPGGKRGLISGGFSGTR